MKKMKIRVYFVSPKGHAESVARAVAGACGVRPEPLMPAYMPENVDLIFLGCEGTRADKVTLAFIDALDCNRARRAALFGCGKDGRAALDQMRRALTARGVFVYDMSFWQKSRLFFGGAPNAADLQTAARFAQDCVNAAESSEE